MTMAMELIRHIAGLYSGKAIKGDFTQVYITGNEIWMAQQVLAEQADGAQGERERFEAWYERTYGVRAFAQNVDHSYVEPLTEMQWAGWQARAALAQPSPAPELDDQAFDINAERLTFQALGPGAGINPEATSIDDIFIDEAPAPDQSEQPLAMVELERPEVVAWMWRDINGDMQFNYMHPEGEPLMTVAQHERIVTAWRHLKDVKYAELYEEAVQLEAKIDAAQAKLAELERQEPVYTKPSWADSYGWSGGYIDFKCATDVEKLARHFEDLLDAVPEGPLYAAPVAQAGQVPEGYMLITQDQVERHATTAWECPPQSRVVLVSTLKRLHEKNSAAPQPAGGE